MRTTRDASSSNTPVFVADGYRASIIPGEPSEVIRTVDEQVVSRIERLGPRKISVTGTFHVGGVFIAATPHGIYTSNGVIRGNTISGLGGRHLVTKEFPHHRFQPGALGIGLDAAQSDAEHKLGLAAGRCLPFVREGCVGRRGSDGA